MTSSKRSLSFSSCGCRPQELDLDRVWEAATEQQRQVLIDELLERVAIFPDHLEVTVHGAPRLNVLLGEVRLGVSAERWCRRNAWSSHPTAPAEC